MTSAIYLGLENKTAKRLGINVSDLSRKQQSEKEKIISEYRGYLKGNDSKYVVPFVNCEDRLDVKHCINDKGRKRKHWLKQGYKVKQLGEILKQVKDRSVQLQSGVSYPLLVVNYNGDIESGETLIGGESSYSQLFQVKKWDILISNMGFGRGAISVVPPHYADKYVSNEYTILKAPSKQCAIFYWNLLRTKEILGDIFSSATGMNRGRIKWDVIQTVLVPEYEGNKEIEKLTQDVERFWRAYSKFNESKLSHISTLSKELDVAGADSFERWLSFKPPE